MAVEIRLLRAMDGLALQKDCFPELPLEDVMERVAEDVALHESGEGVTLVAEEHGRVGMHVKFLRSGETGWIFNVASHQDFRGRNILQELFRALEERARAMGVARLAIHVRSDNLRAIRAYEKAGFKYSGADGMRGTQLRYEKMLNT